MPNPGSPKSMQDMQKSMPQNVPQMPMSKWTMIGMFSTLIISVATMSFRLQIGSALNFIFKYIGFNGQYPVLTLIIAGLIMITLGTIVRSYMTDFIGQARNQKIQSEFNKEMKQARLENNLYKLKKLQEEQPKMTAKSMESSTQMMKAMPFTMLFTIPLFAWVWYFLIDAVSPDMHIIAMPWGVVNLMDSLIVPIWMIIYMMVSIPIGQVENRLVRYLMLNKRLKELDRIEQKS
jgi:uncharacterized membrane protein (DUF106 family)